MAQKNYELDWGKLTNASKTDLLKIYKRYMNIANKRIDKMLISELAKSPAYKKVLSMDGAPFVKSRKVKGLSKKLLKNVVTFKALPEKAKMSDIRRGLLQIEDFLQAKTSTSAGLKSVERNKRKVIAEKFPELPAKDRDAFLRFLGSPEIKDAKKKYDSDVLVMMLEITSRKYGTDDLKNKWYEFEESGRTIAAWVRDIEGTLSNKTPIDL